MFGTGIRHCLGQLLLRVYGLVFHFDKSEGDRFFEIFAEEWMEMVTSL